MRQGIHLKQPGCDPIPGITCRVSKNGGQIPPILEPTLPPDLIFDCDFAIYVEMKVRKISKHPEVEDPHVPSGYIPSRLSLLPIRRDNTED